MTPVGRSIAIKVPSSALRHTTPEPRVVFCTDQAQPPRTLQLIPGMKQVQQCIGATLAILLSGSSIAYSAAADPAVTFENTCSGCHAGGGNIVKRDATLSLSDLQKYGLDNPDALYSIIYSGNGSMPGYGTDCAPKGKCTFGKRLSDSEISDLARYVLEKAKSGW